MILTTQEEARLWAAYQAGWLQGKISPFSPKLTTFQEWLIDVGLVEAPDIIDPGHYSKVRK